MKHVRTAALLLALFALFPAGVFATTTGEELDFNPGLNLIAGNLLGPTAKTLTLVAAFVGVAILMLGMGRDQGWMKIIGSVVILGCVMANLPGIMEKVGMTGASYAHLPSLPLLYLSLAAIGALLLLGAAALLGLLLRRERCSLSEAA